MRRVLTEPDEILSGGADVFLSEPLQAVYLRFNDKKLTELTSRPKLNKRNRAEPSVKKAPARCNFIENSQKQGNQKNKIQSVINRVGLANATATY